MFVTSERDEGHVTQNNGVMVEGLGFNYYGVLVSVIELIYDKGMHVVLFKCKWFNTDPTKWRSTILDRGLLSVDSNSVWYENEPFILATMAKQEFYLDDPVMGEGWKVVQVMSHKNIWSVATLGGDDESGPSEPTTHQPNEPYQEESPHVVSDTEDIRVNNQHVPAIIGYLSITPFELNSLQRRNPGLTHDNNDFIDDEYIEGDEYSDQTEEQDHSDDSDYHEYD
ncbi:hypothetical protein ACLB2K_011667 [Fragaria x ananassa]